MNTSRPSAVDTGCVDIESLLVLKKRFTVDGPTDILSQRAIKLIPVNDVLCEILKNHSKELVIHNFLKCSSLMTRGKGGTASLNPVKTDAHVVD